MDIETCYNLKIRQANRVLTSYYDEYLRELGLKITQFSILRCLWYLKSAPQKELEKWLVLDQATLTRNLKPLIRDGYIQTQRSAEDGRITLVSLTDDGIALYKQAKKNWKKAQDNVSKKLGEDMSQKLLDVSEALLELKLS